MSIKQCTAEDIDWLMKLGAERYGVLLKNEATTRAWLERIIGSDAALVLRTDTAAIIATCNFLPFHDTPQASVFLFAGDLWGILALFGKAKWWAKGKGAEKLHFRSTTEHNIEALAKRLHASVEYPAYSLRLTDV